SFGSILFLVAAGGPRYEIGKGLTADGIKTAAGNDYWLASTLRKILTNEKYIGDALLQKTVTTDFLTKKRVVNKGIVPQYYVENSHEAIIPREIFMQVKEEMARRANISTGTGKRRVYSSHYALSSIVYCAHCGDLFRRISWNNRGKKSVVWRCVSRVMKKKSGIECPARTVREEDLQAVVVKAINDVFSGRDTIIPILKENIEKVIGSGNASKVEEVEAELADLQKELLKKANARQAYDDIADRIEELRREKQELLLEDANNEESRQRVEEMEKLFDEIGIAVTEYDESLVRKLIEKITVYDDHFTVEFKSGLETEVAM
ncbi:MAG: recombinase family protein, partial [Lachnospiraceae bacterium]|nr:recombinase family protein [Lachnospiraceae bacterium]